ncbi:uncharacterized protein LOC116288820 [Actinia tenebrosa]|uniref:Uncharacterized protein LOC116288820 n=1 Tax=Actinia tenebrosa TaxID=6105 RepID=A0A6P8H8G8_ACTTE|nr:uncharacterized protein LOC116288820 [Actinia tenebrosa]
MNGQEIDETISVDNLTWSSEEFTLSDFVDKFPLPQIVKVQEGYYGPDEDSCLGADQILFLHAVKHTEKVQARDRRKRFLHIPLNCSQKIELRPSNLKDVYESVGEVAKIIHNFPKFVRVTQGFYSMDGDNVSINPGDKLKLLRIVPGEQDDYLIVENQDRTGFPIRIPISAQAGFQPLVDGREYYLKEATSMTPIPFFFQFIDPPQLNATGEPSVFNSTLGVLRVEKTYQDATVICTTKEGTNRTVVSCPKQLQITVAAASGALIGDSNYVRVCRFFHDGVSLKRIENMEAYNVFASRDTIREYVYDVPKVPPSPTTPDEFVVPVVPKQRHKEKVKQMNSLEDEDALSEDYDSDECHDYTYIDDKKVEGWAKDSFDYNSFKRSFDGESRDESTDEPSGQNAVASYIEMDKAEIKNGILYLENPKPPPVGPKPVIPGKTQGKRESTVDTEHTASAAPSSTKTERGPKTNPLGIPINSDDLNSLNIDGVSRFLEQHRLPEFVEAFKYNQIDGEMLVSLDLDMMEALGMNPFQRKKLKKLVDGWRPRD